MFVTKHSFRLGAAICAITIGALGGQAHAQSESGPVCTPKTFVVSVDPASATNIVINPIEVPPACMDATGHQLTLTAVTEPAVLTPAEAGFAPNSLTVANTLQPGQSQTIDFTVTDENGLSATSSLTLTRPQPQN